jgi:hypothetical protein
MKYKEIDMKKVLTLINNERNILAVKTTKASILCDNEAQDYVAENSPCSIVDNAICTTAVDECGNYDYAACVAGAIDICISKDYSGCYATTKQDYCITDYD